MTLKESVSPPQYWYDGQLYSQSTLSLPLQDPGWLYGATVFTTLRIYEGALTHPQTAWPAHKARLTASVRAFAWMLPDWPSLKVGAAHLARYYPVLRVTLFPDGRSLISGRSLPPDLSKRQTHGVVVWVATPDYRRSLPGHKTGNYLGCWLALQAAQRSGAQEAILINCHNHWLETSTGNLWGWCRGAWWTPPLEMGILPGVMRSQVLKGLQAQKHRVNTQPWTPEQVSQFTDLAYTNSVVGVVPICSVLRESGSVNYNPDHGKIQQLNDAWRLGAVES